MTTYTAYKHDCGSVASVVLSPPQMGILQWLGLFKDNKEMQMRTAWKTMTMTMTQSLFPDIAVNIW